MKINCLSFKLLPLILILTGVLATSGCVDSQAQPIIYKYQGDLYRSIFYPYAGLLKGNEMQDAGPRGPHSGMPDDHDSSHSLRDAAFMLEKNIKKAEAMSAKFELGAQYLRDQGKDVNRLESLIEEYNGLVDEAKYYLELAKSSSGEEESTTGINSDSEDGLPVGSTEKDYLIQSQKSMVRANLVLKDIFEEFKLLNPGSEKLNETDRLNAAGEGRATLMGSFDLKLHLENGKIAVMSPESIINIEGNYAVEIKEGGPEDVLVYHIQSADLEVFGPRKVLLLDGKKINVDADGEGYVAFLGNGTYSVEKTDGKKEGQWAAESLLNEGMVPEEPDGTGNRIHSLDTHGPETGEKSNFIEEDDYYRE